jgi:transcriptional regulator with XRE-family HTH domain
MVNMTGTIGPGERIKQLRELAGLSPRALGKIAKLAGAGIWNIEHGKGNPTHKTLQSLANVFGVKVSHLTDGEGEVPTADQIKAAVEIAREAASAHDTLQGTPEGCE